MSLTAYASGQLVIAGCKFNSANDWNSTNTGSALGAGDAIELLPKSTPKPVVVYANNDRIPNGVALRFKREKVQESVAGSFSVNLGYRGCARLAASFFGTEVLATLVSGAYSHVLTLNPGMGGCNLTLAFEDNLVAHDTAHWRTDGLTLSLNNKTIGELAVSGFGKQELTDGSGANTLAALESSLTLPAVNTTRYQMLTAANTRVRLALAASAALGSAGDYQATDLLYPSAITIAIKRAYTQNFTGRNNPLMDEPVAGNWLGITGNFEVPVHEYPAFYRAIVGGSDFKLDVRQQGAQIAATGFYDTWFWEFPGITIDPSGLPDINTVDVLPITIPFTAETAATAPTGMAFTTPRLTIYDASNGKHLDNVA